VQVLITAGATRNPIDAVRFLSARSSGTTGVAVARALQARGAEVWLLGSDVARSLAPELPGEEYQSTRDLLARVQAWVTHHPDGCVVHASAVGDYEAAPNAGKLPSGQAELTLTLRPTPKIADQVRGWGLTGRFVTFKAAPPETSGPELERIASAQRARTRCDLVFANVLGRLGEQVALVGEDVRWFDRRSDGLDALIDAILPAR